MAYGIKLGLDIRENDPPFPNVWDLTIVIERYSTDSEGRIPLSPLCVSQTEIAHYIDALIQDLEAIRRQAKSALAVGV